VSADEREGRAAVRGVLFGVVGGIGFWAFWAFVAGVVVGWVLP